MDLLIFSGNSLRNRDYAYQAQDKLKDLFSNTYIQDYAHWQTGQEWIDLPHELEVLKATNHTGSYGVMAKSIGTVLTVQAIANGILKPKFLLLLGIPLGYITKDYPEFGKALADANIPTLIIHNEHDPVGTAQDVHDQLQHYITNSPSHRFMTTEGKTHDYENYALLREQLSILSAF